MAKTPSSSSCRCASDRLRVENVRVGDFRNLAAVSFEPDPHFNVLWGDNGQGKTNLLEAIYVLGALKSFRSFKNRELIREGAEQATIEAVFDRGGSRRDARVTVRPTSRRVEVNQKPVTQLRDFFGTFNAVVFCPDDIGVLRASPADRRTFFDRMIFHAQASYGSEFGDYETTLRSRNAMLRSERPDRALIEVYDQQLGRLGARIVVRRLALLDRLAVPLQALFAEIFGAGFAVGVRYEPDGLGLADGQGLAELGEDGLAAHLTGRLRRAVNADLERGHTALGPHRDDFGATLDGRPIRSWGSQGQHRTLALALKISEIKLLSAQLGYDPVLLLDDVSSELDPERNRRLFEFLSSLDGQVFITTTDPSYVRIEKPMTRWRIHSGELQRD